MTFSLSGTISIKQTGHGLLSLPTLSETHLIPLLDVRILGLLSGIPYPEVVGTYRIVSSSGFISEITFSGLGILGGGKRNSFEAVIYSADDRHKSAIYTASGQWSDHYTFWDAVKQVQLETYSVPSSPPAPLKIHTAMKKDPWHSRNAWKKVFDALKDGDTLAVGREKAKLEEAQREMRRLERNQGIKWQQAFFDQADPEQYERGVFGRLARIAGVRLEADKTKGVWTYTGREKSARSIHEDLTPFGYAH